MKTKTPHFFLLGCLLLLISSTYCQDDSSSDDGTPVTPDGFDDDMYDDLNDFMMDDDMDIDNFENYQDYYSRSVQDHDVESLVEAVSENNLVLVLYLNEMYPEDNKIYEDFFKSLAPYFGSGAFETEVVMIRYFDEKDSELANYYVPNSFPAIVLFDHVRMFEYADELELPEFFGWFTQVTSREFTELQDQDSLDRFLESDQNPKLIAFYSSRDTMELEILSELGSKEYLIHLDVRQIAICLEHCTATYGDKSFNRPSLVLFRNYENVSPYAILNQNLNTAESVFSFVNYESLPPVIYYDELNQTKIFGEVIKSQITVVLDSEADNSDIISQLEKSAYYNLDHESREQRIIHIVNYFDEASENLHWFYNIHNSTGLPKLFITQTSDDLEKIYKFRYDGNEPLNYETFRKFITDYREGKLEHFFISEEIPDNEGKTVNKIVGNTYKQEVLDSDVNYLVYICPEIEDELCSEPLETFESAAKKIVESGDAGRGALKFGYIDVMKNEMDMDLGDSFPEIKLYKSGNKKRPVPFKTSFTEEELVEWIVEQVNQIESGLNRKDNLGERENVKASVEL